MPPSVGKLDNPGMYNMRSITVYCNASGKHFIHLDTKRHYIHENVRWTAHGNTSMQGNSVYTNQEVHSTMQLDDPEDAQLAYAIAASLEDTYQPENQQDSFPSQDADNTAPNPCVICMTDAPRMIMRPCNHLCACQNCAARLNRQPLPCPICRRRVTKIERIFF